MLCVKLKATTNIAPTSSIMAKNKINTFKLCGIFLPKTAKQPMTNAVSVDMTMPQPTLDGWFDVIKR